MITDLPVTSVPSRYLLDARIGADRAIAVEQCEAARAFVVRPDGAVADAEADEPVGELARPAAAPANAVEQSAIRRIYAQLDIAPLEDMDIVFLIHIDAADAGEAVVGIVDAADPLHLFQHEAWGVVRIEPVILRMVGAGACCREHRHDVQPQFH